MPRRFDYLADVEAFVTVVEKGTLSAAAVALGTTPSVLSRAISRLETRLGVQLLRRTTRRLNLTDAGLLYLEQSRSAFAMIDDAERRIQGQDGPLTGRVRLSVPTTYGHYRLPQLLARFAEACPQVRIELSITNRNVDLVAEGYDLAIRLGQLPDSGLVGRKLEDARLCLVAAPQYLERAGTPRHIDELTAHACLPFVMPSSGRIAPWLFRENGEDREWVPTGKVQVSDDVLGIVSLAQAGMGICQTYDFIVRERVERGELRVLLDDFGGRSRPFSVIYPPHRQLPAAARALIDFLIEQ
ncbi:MULTISPECIES: LysR family transcriptional regulator [Pseudomonas]|uniref:LysR family transcriptional regulator n=1 Tax=Pseudomonas TaxID=286 RepID=UPI000876D9ED|nr:MULTISPECIES: LysR family transcriptional regulator [Pseudomonas]MDB6443382.1 LysR family transcriptional regulator [Pseudomonas sp. 21TX0197]MDT8904451.1 LysR family transcriptional regulator [Pseudomonas prosekii]NHN69176.1 LysR family transcriptional regulator [Pseudomonas fluorescens]ROO35793.1 LuxR family transcriptional regulator [Pseudomonas sp. 7SR1]ROO36921.1 LuxR family transcriptional regulator [Pseudomonas sp. AF76]